MLFPWDTESEDEFRELERIRIEVLKFFCRCQ